MESFKENWKVYLLMTFISAMFAFAATVTANGYINKETKIDNAASVSYVDEKHNLSIKYTDDVIKLYADIEDDKIEELEKHFDDKFEILSDNQDVRFQDLKDYIKLLKQ